MNAPKTDDDDDDDDEQSMERLFTLEGANRHDDDAVAVPLTTCEFMLMT